MATASPTPMGMGSNHFGSLSRRPVPARQSYKTSLPARPQLHRNEALPAEAHAQATHYALNDSSDDDEIPPPMKFSAITRALLNDEASLVGQSPPTTARTTPEPSSDDGPVTKPAGIVMSGGPHRDHLSPAPTRISSPLPQRVVRLSSTPGSSNMRRATSLASSVKKHNEKAAAAATAGEESALDLNTPAPIPRTVRIPISSSGANRLSFGSSGRNSNKVNSAARLDDDVKPQVPSTVAKPFFSTSQGSVSRYGSSTIGRNGHGEELGMQSSMRVKRVEGIFMRGPARRGKRRQDADEHSPVEEHGDALNAASNQEYRGQESQSQALYGEDHVASPEVNRASAFAPSYRDFHYGSPMRSKDALNTTLRSKSPPPLKMRSPLGEAAPGASLTGPKEAQPVFKVPDLPSSHDQENEAPPTFKRHSKPPLRLDARDKVSARPESLESSVLRPTASSERRPLMPRSHNTPLRPAPPPPKMSVLEAATSAAGASTTTNANVRRNRIKVNGTNYTRLGVIGRGGSGKVYRVMADNSKMFALKRVSLENCDEAAVRGFKGEIDLLQKLDKVERVIRLWDYELNDEKAVLTMLMEIGEMDFKSFLDVRLTSEQAKLDVGFVRHYWKEMLECLEAVHEHDIVHSDLKPHNFVLVQGRLKLIDFGIANAIETDETVNVHRENQIGTPNYMSPESLLDSNATPDSRGRIPNEPKLMKLGKPSDVWSLGCILYQMVYGRPPFDHIKNQLQRCQAIINFNYAIEYPSVGVGNIAVPGSLIGTMKKCLERDHTKRPSATQLLSSEDRFLNPMELDDGAVAMTEELLGRILRDVAGKCRDRVPSEAEVLSLWPAGYFSSIRRRGGL